MRTASSFTVLALGLVCGGAAHAQDQGGGTEGGEPQVVVVPQPPPPQPPPPPDVNAHLPSSSRATGDINKGDGFDLGRQSSYGGAVRGSAGGAYITGTGGDSVPDLHTVKRGDTLWDISQRYTGNPYNWPRLWSYNKQIQNPHWLYPGDHLKLRGDYGVRQTGSGVGFSNLRPTVAPDTVFLREVGFIEDGENPAWGTIVGSPEDQMLLSEHDQIYIQLESDREVSLGEVLTVFESKDVKSMQDENIVFIKGSVRVNRYNAKTGMVRAQVIEALDIVERGMQVGPVERRFITVAPRENQQALQAHIVGSFYPYQFYGQHQLVLIDKGTDDGVEMGNRFFAVRHGDPWAQSLDDAGSMTDDRGVTEDDRDARTEDTPSDADNDDYPTETYAEILVVRLRKKSATCIVTGSKHEIPRGAVVVARQGY
ncbi:MAG: LysM peptidoglycan-binding domain-containing protein [Polyangiaceae bacterium]|nr:LysM peptidoglycan-binding domain-containing protein [Polyangiaceae bacterium]